MRNCCICSSNVGTVGRTRCKLLNRPSCNGEKAYLEKIATKWLGVSLTDFKDIGQNLHLGLHSFPPWPYALVHAALSSKRHSHLLNSINDILCGTQRQSTIYKICRSAEQVVSAKFTRPFPRGGAYNL